MAEDAARNSNRLIVLSPSTLRDQSAIYNYTAEQWSEAQAEVYADYLDSILRELARNPTVAAYVKGLTGVRSYIARWQNARQGHRIFFEETETGIYVLRILHTARNWPDYFSDEE